MERACDAGWKYRRVRSARMVRPDSSVTAPDAGGAAVARGPRRFSPLRYTVALASVIAALLARSAVPLLVADTTALLAFVPAVMVSAWYGGAQPGLLATFLSVLAGTSLWLDLPQPFRPEHWQELVNVSLFAGFGVAISLLFESLHASRY